MAVSAGEPWCRLELAAARAEIVKLHACARKKTLENEILKERWITPPKKVDCALALVAGEGQ